MSRSMERTMPPAVPGIPTRSSKKEEATLRRVFGFVACASLLTAMPWWVSRGETAEPSRVREAAGSADSSASSVSGPSTTAPSMTAAQLFQQGRQDYLAGRYDEAVAALEAASRASRDLSDSDRERLTSWLAQVRSKATGANATADKTPVKIETTRTETPARQAGVVARGQSADLPSQPALKPTDPKSNAAN